MSGNLISCDKDSGKIYIHNGISSGILGSFDSPYTWPSELAYDSSTGNLISCDRDANKIYIHDGISSGILGSFDSPSNSPIGLAYDSSTGNLISCDYHTYEIYIHDGISSSVLSSFNAPSSYPHALTYDSSTGNLISYCGGTGKIYIHDGISSGILGSFDKPAGIIEGLAYDSSTGNLISCDDSNNKIYIHDGISSGILGSPFNSPSTGPQGLTIAPPSSPLAPDTLKCEGATNPSEVTDRYPELTAIYHHPYDTNGRYYRVQVANDAGFSSIVWDSGKKHLPTDIANGATCQPISVGHKLLLNGSKYYWRIKFWDILDNEGLWSTE